MNEKERNSQNIGIISHGLPGRFKGTSSSFGHSSLYKGINFMLRNSGSPTCPPCERSPHLPLVSENSIFVPDANPIMKTWFWEKGKKWFTALLEKEKQWDLYSKVCSSTKWQEQRTFKEMTKSLYRMCSLSAVVIHSLICETVMSEIFWYSPHSLDYFVIMVYVCSRTESFS